MTVWRHWTVVCTTDPDKCAWRRHISSENADRRLDDPYFAMILREHGDDALHGPRLTGVVTDDDADEHHEIVAP